MSLSSSQSGADRGSGLIVLAALCLFCACAAIPFITLPVPASFDYPNHLTRMWLIAGGVKDTPLPSIFQIDWTGTLTNVGIDYAAALFGPTFGATNVGAFMFWLAVILPPLGAIALNRALFERWSFWQPAIFLLAYPSTLIAGFLNFQFSLGLALFAAALFLKLRRTWSPLALLAYQFVAGVVLLVAHVFGLMFYAVLIGAIAAGREAPRAAGVTTGAWLVSGLSAAIRSTAPLLAIPALFYLFAPHLPGDHADPDRYAPIFYFMLRDKLITFFTVFGTFDFTRDVLFLIAFLLPCFIAVMERWASAHFGLLLSVGFFLFMAAISPQRLAGTWWIEDRFPIMAALTLAACVDPFARASGMVRRVGGLALGVVVLARIFWIGDVWNERAQDIASVARAVENVPPGSAILPVDIVQNPDHTCKDKIRGRWFNTVHATYWSYPVLATMWRKAFVPNIFWAAGKQPLKVLAPWNEISIPEDKIYTLPELRTPQKLPDHFKTWRQRYDFVLVMNGDCGFEELRPEGISLVRDEGFARLFRVERP